MSSATPRRGSLHVRRLTSRYRVAAGHPDPDALRRRMDGLVRRDLPDALADALAALDGDERVVLIERLEVDLVVDAGSDPDALIGRWTRGILRELGLSLAGDDASGVIQFASADAYRARFLQDLLQGQAWGRWYYRRFDGLRSLPLSQALRTLLCDGEGDARAVVGRLSEAAFAELAGSLSEQDSGRVLLALAGDAGDARRETLVSALSAVLEQPPSLLSGDMTPGRCAFVLLGESIRRGPTPSGPWVAGVSLAVARLRRVFAREGAEAGGRRVRELADGDQVALYRKHGGDASHWLPLSGVDASVLATLAGSLRRHASGAFADALPEPALRSTRSTRLGGLFLLLPLLDSLPLAEIVGDWPDPETSDGAGLLRLLLMMKALGQPRAGALFVDPLARELLDLPPSITPGLLRRWQGTLSNRQLEGALDHLHRWQMASGIAGAEEGVLAGFKRGDGSLAILIDGAGGWLGVRTLGADLMGLPGERFHGLERLPLRRLWTDSSLAPLVEVDGPDLQVVLRDRTDTAEPPPAGLAETLTRLERLPAEWRHLSLPPAFRGPRLVDRTLTLFAQGLLRALARRLPGFAHASLPYLYTHFLAFGARYEGEGKRGLVYLEPPPLQPVLGMTGLARGHYRLSWLPDIELELRSPG